MQDEHDIWEKEMKKLARIAESIDDICTIVKKRQVIYFIGIIGQVGLNLTHIAISLSLLSLPSLSTSASAANHPRDLQQHPGCVQWIWMTLGSRLFVQGTELPGTISCRWFKRCSLFSV